MENQQHEKYEYARRRIKQKKRLYYHFIFFLIGSLFFLLVEKIYDIQPFEGWYLWAVTLWFFFFILHFIKVYITDRFMNKNWEREQIDRLMALQDKKIEQLQKKIESEKSNTAE
ncbi:2TM domain-containing protein [Flavobacterium sp. UBA6135]|uniref:2TM domain-containing protein n=1 Tax=Flavobacterium sp. UBA6135 TaxID=1946553 RepID=UPI0025C4B20E|nr:2TM domain-containing protein [Flavobacterium sp. UBA6135]